MHVALMILAVAIASPSAPGTVVPFEMEITGPAGFVFVLEEPAPPVDLRAAIAETAAAMVHQEAAGWADAQQPDDNGTGYFGMMYQNTYDPAVLAYLAASTAEIWSASALRDQCEASQVIACTNPWPNTVQMDAMITAGVYAGVTGLQRLAKTQWDVDLDEGWKNVAIWGGIAAVRMLITAINVSDANALREFGR